jgi:glucan phosphoethanolaminetransferase (alkaline phosphatase superfamily)
MALRLFRTTGFSTLLMPGESRVAPHPARIVLWASLWIGVACNVAVWRLFSGDLASARTALSSAAILTGGSALLFSIFGWRRTLKPVVTLALLAATLIACGLWSQQLPIQTLWQGPSRAVLPAWASFLRWQLLALVLVLGLVPMVTVWNMTMRRLPGPSQMRANMAGVFFAGLLLALGILLA